MKTNLKNVRITFWVIIGLALSFTSLALNHPKSALQEISHTPTLQPSTIVATTETVEGVGSTDGIMLVAVVIVLIVIIPILLRRGTWSNRKQS